MLCFKKRRKMKNNTLNNQSQTHGQGQVGYSALELAAMRAGEQIELDCFDGEYAAQAREICLIIAEVFMLPPDAEIQIAGQKMSAALVCGVYNMLRHEDIVAVMDNFEKATYEIRHKKTYIRTALYNSVFEREARAINELRQADVNGRIDTRCECIEKRRRKAAREYSEEQKGRRPT